MSQPTVPTRSGQGWTTDSQSALEILANDLANNYLDTSLGLKDTAKADLRQQIFTHHLLREPHGYGTRDWSPSRNILVLGSGASAATFGTDRFPLVSQAIAHVKKQLSRDAANEQVVERRLKTESERYVNFYGFERAHDDFETQVGILAEIFSPEAVADSLAELYALRYAPHIVFELIAHMLKHRFIDAVINFNFDELLDAAIEEEIGKPHYNSVISDGDCRPLADIMVRDRLKIPLYIKPHGTVQHRSTMRFTKDQYFRLPSATYNFMRDIVGGHHRSSAARGRKDDGYQPYRTNIISVGFGMGSLDLLSMIRHETKSGRSPEDFAIFHINRKELDTWEQVEELRRQTGVERQYLIKVEDFGGIEETLRQLWELVRSRFSPLYCPRGIARHEIVHQLFHQRSSTGRHGYRVPEHADARSDARYYFARLCTEIILGLAKGNGRLDLGHAVSDRVGIYFDLLSRSGTFAVRSISNVIEALGGHDFLQRTGSAQNILTVSGAGSWENSEQASTELAKLLWKNLSKCLRSLGDADLDRRLAEIKEMGSDHPCHPLVRLRTLIRSDAQDIRPRFSHSHFLLFRQPDSDQVLHTNLGVTVNFAKMIKEVEWDLMLAISENGKILEKFRAHRKHDRTIPGGKLFSLIVAETDHSRITMERLKRFGTRLIGNTESKRYYTLPVTQHNHHMVVLLKRDLKVPGKWHPVRAIYYEKVGMGNEVSPVLLDDSQPRDLDVLVTTFFYYVNKADEWSWVCENYKRRAHPAANRHMGEEPIGTDSRVDPAASEPAHASSGTPRSDGAPPLDTAEPNGPKQYADFENTTAPDSLQRMKMAEITRETCLREWWKDERLPEPPPRQPGAEQ